MKQGICCLRYLNINRLLGRGAKVFQVLCRREKGMPFCNRDNSAWGKSCVPLNMARWLGAIMLGVALMGLAAGSGHAASREPFKHGVSLNKAERITAVEKTKARHHQRARRISHRSSQSQVKSARTHYQARVQAKKSKQARLISRHRLETVSATARMARNRDLSDDTTLEMPSADPWLAEAYDEARLSTAQPEDTRRSKILDTAQSYVGTPYRFGGSTPEGFDCSGFVRHVFGENGVSLSRTSREQFQQGQAIPISAVRPGDLIFFGKVKRKHCRIDHVGLYIGEGRFIHAASARSGQVMVSELKRPRVGARVVLARRILEDIP